MTSSDLAGRIEHLCDGLAADGYLRDPTWRAAFHAVPRHLFVPERAWASPNGPGDGHLIDRAADAGSWWETVYSDAAIITQRNDGVADVAEDGEPSSSCSAPGTLAEFHDQLAPEDHNRVLEVGTGTGWTAALLSHRVGGRNVTSIEVDPIVTFPDGTSSWSSSRLGGGYWTRSSGRTRGGSAWAGRDEIDSA